MEERGTTDNLDGAKRRTAPKRKRKKKTTAKQIQLTKYKETKLIIYIPP